MKKNLGYIFLYISALTAIASILCMFGAAVTYSGLLVSESVNFFDLVKPAGELQIGILLAIIFIGLAVVISAVIALLKLVAKAKNSAIYKFLAACGSLFALAGGVLCFLTLQLVGLPTKYYQLGFGAILSGIFAIVSAVMLCAYVFLPSKK